MSPSRSSRTKRWRRRFGKLEVAYDDQLLEDNPDEQ